MVSRCVCVGGREGGGVISVERERSEGGIRIEESKWGDKEGERERDRQTDRQTDRQRQRKSRGQRGGRGQRERESLRYKIKIKILTCYIKLHL